MSASLASSPATSNNLSAFLAVIRWSEVLSAYPNADPYRVCFGGKHTIIDLSNHPALTGEWKGEPLDFLGRDYAGMVSTAAGAYQLRMLTWSGAKEILKLPDFSPQSQDRAAVLLIKGRKALDAVESGNFAAAVDLCKAEWASLPGGSSGQPQKSLAALTHVYSTEGGHSRMIILPWLLNFYAHAKGKLTTYVGLSIAAVSQLALHADELRESMPQLLAFLPTDPMVAKVASWATSVLGVLVVYTRVRRLLQTPPPPA